MMAPASAMAIISSTVTLSIAKATAFSPESTLAARASSPRMPPMNEMRASVRGSPMPRTGASRRSCR
jgi:hypothetical protein